MFRTREGTLIEAMLLAKAGGAAVGILVFLGFVVFVVILGFAIRNAQKFEETCRAAARRLGGRYLEGGFLSNNAILFRLRDREAELEFYGGSKNSPPYTRVRIDVRDVSPGILKIVPDGIGESFLRLFGAQDLRVGDEAFDDRFVVRAQPPALVGRIFSAERRKDVVRTVRTLEGLASPTIDLGREQLRVQVRRKLKSEEEILALARAAEAWIGYLLPEDRDTGIRWVEAGKGADGECQVCGSRLAGDVVHCASCRTPHHRDCWDYAGECSTYACREKRFA